MRKAHILAEGDPKVVRDKKLSTNSNLTLAIFPIFTMLKKEQVIEELKKVVDPELGIDIYTLGLIYNISIEDKKVNIRMTLTSPMCPYGPQIIEDVKRRINSLEGGIKVETEIVFNPPWEIPKEVRSILGI